MTSPAPAITSATLSDSSTGTFYSDVGCTTSTTTTSFALGASVASTFYYKRAALGAVTLRADAYSTNDTHAITILPVYMMAAGIYGYSCAIVSGSVQCSGYPVNGTLGNNDPATHYPSMVQVSGLTTAATSLSVGRDQACAVVDGAVKCWGSGGSGALGDGLNTTSNIPVTTIASGARKVSLGGTRSACALVGDTVRCWGYNSYYQVGDGTNTNRVSPVTVVASGATDVSVGENFTCAVVSGGVKCWGNNGSYQLGDGTTTTRTTPTDVSTLTSGSGVVSVEAGYRTACAITSAGALYCWGRGTSGQIGDGSSTDKTTPFALPSFATGVTSVVQNENSTCVVQSGGLFCSGKNIWGQLGQGVISTSSAAYTATLTSVAGYATDVLAVHHNQFYTNCLTKTDYSMKCWGGNKRGEMAGIATTTG